MTVLAQRGHTVSAACALPQDFLSINQATNKCVGVGELQRISGSLQHASQTLTHPLMCLRASGLTDKATVVYVWDIRTEHLQPEPCTARCSSRPTCCDEIGVNELKTLTAGGGASSTRAGRASAGRRASCRRTCTSTSSARSCVRRDARLRGAGRQLNWTPTHTFDDYAFIFCTLAML